MKELIPTGKYMATVEKVENRGSILFLTLSIFKSTFMTINKIADYQMFTTRERTIKMLEKELFPVEIAIVSNKSEERNDIVF